MCILTVQMIDEDVLKRLTSTTAAAGQCVGYLLINPLTHKVAGLGAAFSKVPRKILGKLLILGATDTQVAMSSRGYSATDEHCTNRPINSVQQSNRKLCSSSSSNSSSQIRSFPKIFLGTFENAAPGRQIALTSKLKTTG